MYTLGFNIKKPWGQVDWKRMNKRVKALADELNIQIDLSLPASMLKPPEQTLIELLRVLMTDCRLLILDEPTASMTDRETNILFRVIRELKNKRTAVLYVTHRMEEIFQLTDRITVLKNGMWVDTVQTKDVNIET